LVPDFYVEDPMDSAVWEISGAEFSKSSHHTADGISIRFPRVTKIRDDKTPKEATTLKELKILFEESKKKVPIQLQDLIKKTEKERDIVKKRVREEEESDEEVKTKKQKKDKRDDDDDDPLNLKLLLGSQDTDRKKDKSKKNEELEDEDMEDEKIDENEFKYEYGSIVKPIGKRDKLLVHCVDNSGNWIDRGKL
jgi:DNA ligase 3